MSADLISFPADAPISGPMVQNASALVFDPDWYRTEYPDVACSGVDPVFHYFSNGAGEGRNPNQHFNTRWYRVSYPDVEASGMNPFMHFLLYGYREGRQPREIDSPPPLAARRRVPARTRRVPANKVLVATA